MSIKERLFKIGRISLMIWGGVSLIGVVLITCYFFYSADLGNETITDKATNADVRFVLNWCELGDERIEKVLKSIESPVSFTGDYLDAYQIKISRVDIKELDTKYKFGIGQWYRGDSLPQLLNETVSFISGFQHEINWFPLENEIKTSNFYIYPWSISCHGATPNAAQLIIVNPADKIVYYIGVKI